MTENMAGRGEGLADRLTESIWAISDGQHPDKDTLRNLIRNILAAAPPSTAPTSDYPGCTVNELALELKRAVMVLCETRGHTGARPCKFCTDMHLWRLYQSIAEPLRTCNCGSPAGPHCESVHVAALATPSPQAPAGDRTFSPTSVREQSSATASGIQALALGWAYESEALYAKVEAAKCLCKRDGPVDECPLHGETANRNDYNIGYADGIDDCALKVLAATQEPAGSGAQVEQSSAKLKCGCQPIHSTECVFRDVRSSQYRHFYEFEKVGSPRKVGEDGPVTRETLEHWLRVVKSTLDPDGWDCDAPELRRMREQLEALLARPSSVPVGEQKQEEGV